MEDKKMTLTDQPIDNNPMVENPDIPVESLYEFTDNKVSSFVRLSDKYQDITSSASTMLLVGIIGILFMILVLADIIPLPLNSSTAWLFDSVMGGIFIIFIISGIISFMHAKQVKIDADEEDKLIEELLTWADINISKEMLDEGLDLTQPEELLYFNRADKIKDKLMHQFENADEALIYEYTEQIYQNIYESDK
ncbi:MAG: hypothetical protein HFG31_03770 [Eubacterium sp.]|nr:hypothetical protein [Eubacterium sp.]